MSGTLEIAPLVQHNVQLFLNRLRAKQVVERFATGYTVAILVCSTVRAGNQMLNGSLAYRQRPSAEKTLAALGKQQTRDVSGHNQSTEWKKILTSIALRQQREHGEIDWVLYFSLALPLKI
jgi:LmbE family N-acetylglucosaminyl deacetylase